MSTVCRDKYQSINVISVKGVSMSDGCILYSEIEIDLSENPLIPYVNILLITL